MATPNESNPENLWPHFSRLSESHAAELTVMERGEGAYVWDSQGRRYLDGLSGLFVVQAGHGRKEIAAAAAKQAETLAFFPLWTYGHPRALELAERLIALAPPGFERVFFTSGGGEAVETAWKLARQYFVLAGQPERYKVIARQTAYHGTTLGALSITGLEEIKEPFRPLLNGATRHAMATNQSHCDACSLAGACDLSCARDIERLILEEGPETVAAVFLEPVQNAGGCFVPSPGYWDAVRDICDRHGVLLVSDDVICAFGRIGAWFGSERVGAEADMITFAKGVTSGYAPLGGVLVSGAIAEAFAEGDTSFAHGYTFGGHPVSCAVALANLGVMEKEDLIGRVRAHESDFRGRLDALLERPIVSEIRGLGYFYGIELSNDGVPFTADQCEWLIRQFLSKRLLELGLHCRADDRGDPVIQLAPPLISGPDEFTRICAIIGTVLDEAWMEFT